MRAEMYFLFVICLCVCAIVNSIIVLHLYLRAENKPVVAMPTWVSSVVIPNFSFTSSSLLSLSSFVRSVQQWHKSAKAHRTLYNITLNIVKKCVITFAKEVGDNILPGVCLCVCLSTSLSVRLLVTSRKN